MLVLKNAKIILKDGIVEGKALAVSDKIEALTSECDAPKNAPVIDCEGGYVAVVAHFNRDVTENFGSIYINIFDLPDNHRFFKYNQNINVHKYC